MTVLLAVLNNEPQIPELPDTELRTVDAQGEPVRSTLSGELFKKLARLQTLDMCVSEDTRFPTFESIKQIAQQTERDVIEVQANALAIQEDGIGRRNLIQRTICELVREAVPSETNRFDVEYFLHPKPALMRRPAPRRQFLD
jgi:hypothetical protein